jgi:hypothetical protein
MANLKAATLCTAQTGNFTSAAGGSTSSSFGISGPGAIIITSTIGATPTVTVNIQGSVDGTNWFNVPYYAGAFVVTPTYVLTAITITTATTQQYILQPGGPWEYVQIVASANTNVTLTATAYL